MERILAAHQANVPVRLSLEVVGLVGRTKRKPKTNGPPRQGHREIRDSVELFSFHAVVSRRPWSTTKSGRGSREAAGGGMMEWKEA